MVSDTVYELCAPILDDGSLDEEVKIDKLQELLVKETTLGGPGLENTVLDILWRHREEAESRTDQVAKSTPKSRYQTIRRSSPAPWGSGRPTTPSTGSPGLGTSPARAPLPVPPPSLNRGRSYNTAVNANSPLGSPRSSFGVPYVSQRPSFNRFDSSPEFASIHRRDSQFTNSDGDWMTKTVDGGDEDDYEEGPINLSAYSGVGALPYDMLRSVAGEQLTDEDLEVALESHGYDLAAALHALSGTVTTESRSAQAGLDSYTPHSLIGKSMRVKAPPFPRPVTPSARSRQGIICKYFLSTGSCLRDDCRFSHDPSKHICKYESHDYA